MKTVLFTLAFLLATGINAQEVVKGIVVDSISKQPLPFATIQSATESKAVISQMNGRFAITLKHEGLLLVSYTGHRGKTISSSSLLIDDTIYLAPFSSAMEEVIIRPQVDKIKRIINTAIKNKPLHNPEQNERYECNVYYKMHADIYSYGKFNFDSIRRRYDSINKARRMAGGEDTAAKKDSSGGFFKGSHIIMTETFSRRLYKKPQKVQEIVLASKFSGLKKTYFANMITDVLPFHVYSDYINLNNVDYINPIAKGWQQRYKFVLEDEIFIDNDTVFILSFKAKPNTSFNSLTGVVYINSNGYAISHFIGANNNGDDTYDRVAKFEHIYNFVNGKWFPQELNYHFAIRRYPTAFMQLAWTGHSLIDSVQFNQKPSYVFDKAHPLKFSDSIDLRNEKQWNVFRKDTLTQVEANTYEKMDSLMSDAPIPLEAMVTFAARFATGRFPIGKIELDATRLYARNGYEGTRLGAGLYTNNKLSKYYSVGGWAGYGLKDKRWKYGASATIYPKGDKENWLSFSYQNNYRIPGEVNIHAELSRPAFRNWLLEQVDVFKEYAITANIKPGYWEIKPGFWRQEFGPLPYAFDNDGKMMTRFTVHQLGFGLRYAYGEKRVPFFDYYLPVGTKYPIFYFNVGGGKISSAGYENRFVRALLAVTYSMHANRWGKDNFRLEAGIIHSMDNKALPKSFLMAGNGFKRREVSFYSYGGFLTMRPFDFYGDKYLSLQYKHDFDKKLWNLKWSSPYVSLGYNMIFGGLSADSRKANANIRSYAGGYHESGILLNHLLRHNVKLGDLNFNGGVFYHWNRQWKWKGNAAVVVGVALTF